MANRITVNGRHIYNVNNRSMISVTSILREPYLEEGEGLKIWKSRNPDHEEQMKKSATIGTIVHYRIQQYLCEKFRMKPDELDLQGGAVTEDMYPLIDGGYKNFMELIRLHKIVPKFVEVTCYHNQLDYAGQIDLIAEFDGVLSIVDWKTSKGIWPKHRAQVVAYQRARNYMSKVLHHHPTLQCVVVGLNALTGLSVEVIKPEQEKPHWDLFWSAFDKYQNAERKPEERVNKEEVREFE